SFIHTSDTTNTDINSPYVDVNTSSGTVRGHSIRVLGRPINEFLGIPFAVPPVGALRFAKPQAIPEPLTDVINATVPKNSCIQMRYPYGNPLTISEDCLVLNIWTPPADSGQPLRPVMVWFYGGAFTVGSIFMSSYNGSVLATHDVLVVSVNYRVNAFGFLYTDDPSAPGNVGLYDQQLALRWVQQNIGHFGGDPQTVTIFGESAGSWSVSAHLSSPLSRGLFRRAIMESAAQLANKKRPILTKEEALLVAKQLARSMNCTDGAGSEWLECLRGVDAMKFLDYHPDSTYDWNLVYGTDVMPVTAQVAFDRHEFASDVDLLAGVTALEGSALAYYTYPVLQTDNMTKVDFRELVVNSEAIFHTENVVNITDYYLQGIDDHNSSAIRRAFFEFYGDVLIACPTYLFAKLFATYGPNGQSPGESTGRSGNVFFYEWNYGSSPGAIDDVMGVTHGADLRYVFGLALTERDVNYTETDRRFARQAMTLWTDFAKYGYEL
ncbi:unnamed protein product, partial [Medioppia subpectinata]